MPFPWYLKLLFPGRCAEAKSVVCDLIITIHEELDNIKFNVWELPSNLQEDALLFMIFRSLKNKSAEDIKKNLLEEIKRQVRDIRINRLSERILQRKFLFYKGIEFNKLTIRSLLNSFPDSSLAQLEEDALNSDTNLDKLVLVFIQNMENEREKAVRSLDSWGGGGHGGREATSKGSIGHDLLNVKTLRPSVWNQQAAIIFHPVLTLTST